jgi:hypothetical protein
MVARATSNLSVDFSSARSRESVNRTHVSIDESLGGAGFYARDLLPFWCWNWSLDRIELSLPQSGRKTSMSGAG